MDSLFSRLQSYCPQEGRDPKEDFFTEAFCFILDMNRDVLKEYVKFLMGKARINIELDNRSIFIETQRIFGVRRPDVVITFRDSDENNYMIICEHKLDAGEGGDQLNDYFNILCKRKVKGVLAFITKHYISTTSLNKNGEEIDYSESLIKKTDDEKTLHSHH